MKSFFREMELDPSTVLHFYGAGCAQPHNRKVLEDHFREAGFLQVYVDSDLLGACRGLLGETPGLAGILGTGSVLAAYDGKEVVDIYGGFGYLIGDEGSGYAFGRQLIHAYLNGTLPQALTARMSAQLGDRAAVLKEVYGQAGKAWIGKLASEWGAETELQDLHRANIAAFVDLYLDKVSGDFESVCFAGSYAFHNSKILASVLAQSGWKMAQVVQKPIALITDYTIKATL